MESKEPLGPSPALLAKRELVKQNQWCQKSDIEFDSWCDPDNPKTITYKDVIKAAVAIKEEIPKTPLMVIFFVKILEMRLKMFILLLS
ncbi:unnamed protein product [Diatraea saccharalis]|uniref:Uncharacterized protein n=1 Tax=Diatraea saccharalis TaxID=40085 RepID=A0A9P0CA90_9NEOP|nr:unnamed protein product [Diatraea saccharalis]